MKSWGVSLAIHAVVLGLGAALWQQTPSEPEPDRFRWEVAFTPAAQPPPTEPAPRKKPPPKPAIQKPDTPPPRPAPVPQAAPKPPPMALAAVAPEPTLAMPLASATASATTEPPAASPATPLVASKPRPAMPTPPVDAAAEAERRWYAALVDKLREMKRYPLPARRLGQEGVVLLVVQVAADGRLVSVEVKKGSGYPILDRDAVKLLENAAEAARGSTRPDRSARLEIPIAYRLETGNL